MIRLRVIITILFFTALLAALVYSIASNVLLESYRQIEVNGMERDLVRFDEAIENYTGALRIKLLDWAQWDDTYQFVQDHNEEYIEANLADSTLTNLEINLMAFYDANGELVHANYVDLGSGEPMSPDSILPALHSRTQFVVGSAQAINGILKLDQGLLIVQALPILPTSGEGEPAGLLVFARYLDDTLQDDLSGLTQLSVDVYMFDQPQLPQDVLAYVQAPNNSKYTVVELTEKLLAGYLTISQPNGTPAAVVRVTSARDVFLQGKDTVTSFTLLTSAAILFFGLVLLVLLEILLLRRFARLTADVEKITIDDLHNAQVRTGSQDEIGAFAKKINHLLSALAQAQSKSEEASQRVQTANEQLEQNLKETEEMNKLMVGRELKMVELKSEIETLKKALGRTDT